MAIADGRRIQGRISTKHPTVYTPNNVGVLFLIQAEYGKEVIATTTQWSPDPIDHFEVGDVVVVTLRPGEHNIESVRRLVPLAFLGEIRGDAGNWLGKVVEMTFTETLCGPGFQTEIARLTDVVKQVLVPWTSDQPGPLSEVQTLTARLAERSALAASHLMEDFLVLIGDVLTAIAVAFAAEVRGQIEEHRLDESVALLKRVSVALKSAPQFPKLREAA